MFLHVTQTQVHVCGTKAVVEFGPGPIDWCPGSCKDVNGTGVISPRKLFVRPSTLKGFFCREAVDHLVLRVFSCLQIQGENMHLTTPWGCKGAKGASYWGSEVTGKFS